jgi:hypothetical protein
VIGFGKIEAGWGVCFDPFVVVELGAVVRRDSFERSMLLLDQADDAPVERSGGPIG